MVEQQSLKAFPCEGGLPGAPSQPIPPYATHHLIEAAQGVVVPASTVVLVVPADLLRQCLLLLPYWLVAITAAPVRDRPDRSPQSARRRCRLDCPSSSSRLAPVQCESEEVKRPRFWLVGRRANESHQSRLFWVDRQTELGETLPQYRVHSFGITLMRECQHKIVRKSGQLCLAGQPWFHL